MCSFYWYNVYSSSFIMKCFWLIVAWNAVTEDFSCPFCLIRCASFKVISPVYLASFIWVYLQKACSNTDILFEKAFFVSDVNISMMLKYPIVIARHFNIIHQLSQGLRLHLCSSHDLFNFEFWVGNFGWSVIEACSFLSSAVKYE